MSFILDRPTLRRRSVPHFIRSILPSMAERERTTVQILSLSRPGRLIRIGEHVFIQLNKRLSDSERAVAGMHELCHFWRDDPGEVCYNVEEDALLSDAEQFADIFAWVVTSPARIFLPGLRDEDF